MNILELDRPSLSSAEPTRKRRTILRIPFYFESRGEPLFAWFHTTDDQNDLTHAAVIAAPLGYEQIHAHRSLRHLADHLAQHGISALRFDWHGTGDSAGVDEDPDRICTWQANLRDAVQLLQQQFLVQHISVVGLRLGATLAAATLNERDVVNLVLWAPVVNGRTYVREMMALDRTSEIAQPQVPGAHADLEPAGLTLCGRTAHDISKIHLLQRPLPRCRTLIVSRDDVPVDQKLPAAYAAARIPAEQISVPGFSEIFASPHHGEVPREAIQEITKWLRKSDSTTSISANQQPNAVFIQEMTTSYRPEEPARPSLDIRLRERALEISTQPHLFGIISEPIVALPAERPTIILLNAGAAYRAGPGRLHVHLARRLAAEGYRCLRLDVNGLGDSVADEEHRENNSYSSTALRDIDLTMQFLRQQKLGQRFALLGLCSGAYAAFQAAVSLSDASLIESILLNPLTFYWRDGMTIKDSFDRRLVVQHYYLGSALQPAKWLKLLSGKTNIGWRGAARLLADKLQMLMPQPVANSPDQSGAQRPAHSHPLQDDLPADLAQAMEHGRHLAMFLADTDPGYAILTGKAGKLAKSLQKSGRLNVEFLTNSDHNFSRRSARRDLVDALTTHLQRRYPTH